VKWKQKRALGEEMLCVDQNEAKTGGAVRKKGGVQGPTVVSRKSMARWSGTGCSSVFIKGDVGTKKWPQSVIGGGKGKSASMCRKVNKSLL